MSTERSGAQAVYRCVCLPCPGSSDRRALPRAKVPDPAQHRPEGQLLSDNGSWPSRRFKGTCNTVTLQAPDAIAVKAAVLCWIGRAGAKSESLAAESFDRLLGMLWTAHLLPREQITALCHISRLRAFAHVFSEAAASILAKMVAITPSSYLLPLGKLWRVHKEHLSDNSTNPDVWMQKQEAVLKTEAVQHVVSLCCYCCCQGARNHSGPSPGSQSRPHCTRCYTHTHATQAEKPKLPNCQR